MRERPDTRFTDVDGFAIAYQIVGSWRSDLLFIPQFVSNVEENWLLPEHARFTTDSPRSHG